MIDIVVLLAIGLLVLGVLAVLPSLVLPVIFCYGRDYTTALYWLRRYFKHDMALYSPFDLVYLYIVNGKVDEIPGVYRNYMKKGNIGSEYFVEAWAAAHMGRWREAEQALQQLRKYTITNDVDLEKLEAAIAHKSAEEVDEIYLVDMNGRAFVHPSLFRVCWVALVGLFLLAATVSAGLYIALRLVAAL